MITDVRSIHPIFVNGKRVGRADFYSNGEGEDVSEADSYSNGIGDFFNSDSDKGKKLAGAIGVATLLGGVASKLPKRQPVAGAESCGKRPPFKGKRRDAWQACVDKATGAQTAPQQAPVQDAGIGAPTPKEGMSKGLKIGLIVGGSLIAVLLVVLIVKKSKA